MKTSSLFSHRVGFLAFGLLLLAGCSPTPPSAPAAAPSETAALVGAWRAQVQFSDGAFASTKDLEFLYAFNVGGTMTESSNYDGAPPVAPAYGIWRKLSDTTYEAKYEYFWTKPPVKLEELTKGAGWMPGGVGVLTQKFTIAADGKSFDSTITYDVFDSSGKPTEKASHATAKGTKITF